MADGQHGGYRRPANPAPVSGPGRLSKRTDGGPGDSTTQKLMAPTGMAYGDHTALLNQERTAPMAQSPSAPTASMPAPSAATSQPTYQGVPFGSPSSRPDEPITHGVDIGEGGGSDVLPLQHQPQWAEQGPMTQMLAQLSARDMTGALANLYSQARADGV